MKPAAISDRKFIAPALSTVATAGCLRSIMSAFHFPDSDEELTYLSDSGQGAQSDRRSRIVDEIVAATAATPGFAGKQKPLPRRPAIVDPIAGVIIATLALAVLLCLAAISPAVWRFASDAASQLRGELSQCLSIDDGGSRLACYDEIARRPPPQPAKGANAPAAAFRYFNR
jgi:hypothetical protein